MFRGNRPAKVDEKGRLKVPAEFVKLIQEKNYGNEFFITSKDEVTAEIWPLPEWEKIEARLAEIPDSLEEKEVWLSTVNYYGQQVEMDKQDRLVLPQNLRLKAGLENVDVAVIGMQTYLRVHLEKSMQQRIEARPIDKEVRNVMAGFKV